MNLIIPLFLMLGLLPSLLLALGDKLSRGKIHWKGLAYYNGAIILFLLCFPIFGTEAMEKAIERILEWL